jgi:putative SOS response-associated peptidase YedK
MCGRFYLSSEVVRRMKDIWPNLFDGLEQQVIEQVCNGDIRPTNQILTINPEPRWQLMRWGWSRDFNKAVINARTDKLTGRFWGKAVRERRCVIIASGFYEWEQLLDRKGKQVKAIQTMTEGPMIFAGLWELNAELGPCATIVTTDAPGDISHIHDRCPAILDKAGMEKWLNKNTKPEEALQLCTPYAGPITAWDCWKPAKDQIPSPPRPSEGLREQREMF